MRQYPTTEEVDQQRKEIVANKGVIMIDYTKATNSFKVKKENFGEYFSVWDVGDEMFVVIKTR